MSQKRPRNTPASALESACNGAAGRVGAAGSSGHGATVGAFATIVTRNKTCRDTFLVFNAAPYLPVASMSHSIVIRGARQNNLKNLDLELPTNELIVVTGVSGSGKSSLVFDTIYAEGQRRYVETFSPYARQFLDRMDRPQVERIEGIPPAIAIDQTNPVRTSRSTVGTMTELNDHLKLLFSRAAQLYCRDCGAAGAARLGAEHLRRARRAPDGCSDLRDCRLVVTFPVPVPHNFSETEVLGLLEKQGYTRVFARSEPKWSTTESSARKGKRGGASTGAERQWQCRAGDDPGPCALRERRSRPRDRSAGVGVAHRARPCRDPRARRRGARRARLALLLRPALCRLRHPLPRADAEPVLVQFAARRVRQLPRFRPHHRHRLRPHRARRVEIAARRRRAAVADASRIANARTIWCASRASAACRSIRRGAS